MTDEEPKVRTMSVTYEADDDTAELFNVVVGTVMENFRGVRVVEMQDDSVFADEAAEDALRALMLTGEQRAEIESFARRLGSWTGEVR